MNYVIMMGIFWYLIGVVSVVCFYVLFKKVKYWLWEIMWLVGGIVFWLILFWVISVMLLFDFWVYYCFFSVFMLLLVFLFGVMWGIGNINYGLIMCYFGMLMGIGIVIGIMLIVGMLMMLIINGQFVVLMYIQGG